MQKRNNIMLHFHGAIEGNQAICLIEDGYLYLPAELCKEGEEPNEILINVQDYDKLEENKELRIETTRKHHYL